LVGHFAPAHDETRAHRIAALKHRAGVEQAEQGQAPDRSSLEMRSGISGSIAIEAAPAPAPGHCKVVGALVPCCATTEAPLICSVALCASPLSVTGFTSRLTVG